MLEIENKLVALDFDRACNQALLQFDNERRQEEFKTLAAILGAEVKDKPKENHQIIRV